MPSRTLDDKVDEILDVLAEMRGRQEGWEKWRDEVCHDIYGNGNPGLKTDVDRLKKDADRRERFANWITTLVVTNIAGIISFVVYFLKHF